MKRISIHALREEGDLTPCFATTAPKIISIHALREEGDVRIARGRSLLFYFYPRPPRGGRLGKRVRPRQRRSISIHALREEGDGLSCLFQQGEFISIHALREEGDLVHIIPAANLIGISIHALREEGDSHRAAALLCITHFYPRPPRGGRLARAVITPDGKAISIHALREEGDP